MDRASLREPRGSYNTSLSPRYQSHTWQSSQLPTPETSRSGYEPEEDDCEGEILQVRSRGHERRLQSPNDSTANVPYLSSKRSSSRRDSCNLRSPDSPPYHGGDSHTLSLPPLKTVRNPLHIWDIYLTAHLNRFLPTELRALLRRRPPTVDQPSRYHRSQRIRPQRTSLPLSILTKSSVLM